MTPGVDESALNALIDEIERRLVEASADQRLYAYEQLTHIVGVMNLLDWVEHNNAEMPKEQQ